jgi:hypothetical protein
MPARRCEKFAFQLASRRFPVGAAIVAMAFLVAPHAQAQQPSVQLEGRLIVIGEGPQSCSRASRHSL